MPIWLIPLEIALFFIMAALFLLVLSCGIFFHVARCERRAHTEASPHEGDDTGLERFSEQMRAERDWLRSQGLQTWQITALDGVTLTAHYLATPDARGTVILLHGFRSEPEGDFGGAAAHFQSRGFHVLMPVQRAHAGSEGRYIGFGLLERYDIQAWARSVAARHGPGHPIVLYGVSMGATTVLMASALELPENVRGLIADCGYTSPKEMFRAVMRRDFSLPEEPVLAGISLAASRFAGYRLDSYSTLEALKCNERPILFIHGRRDDLVPPEMTVENFRACHAPKRLLMVDSARHAGSFFEEPELYLAAVDDFLHNCVGLGE